MKKMEKELPVIYQSEWEAALNQLKSQPKSDEGYTTEELRDLWGFCNEKVRKLIRTGIKMGVIVLGKRNIMTINDRNMSVPVYCLRDKAAKK